MRKIRLFAPALAIMLVLLCALPGGSAAALSEEEITSPSAVLMDASSGKILFEKNSHEKRSCASITKVMTLLLVMEALDDGKIHLDDVVSCSAHAASMGGSDIWLEEGEQMSVDDLLKATVVASANDAAVALAEFISGSEEDFVRRMNERAGELIMQDTTFMNCNGLDEEGHLTSAYDVAVMSRELIRHEKIFDYSTIWLDQLRGGETQIVNTNKLLRSYNGITGLKTGTTSQAGSCITATAERDGLSLIAVILGAESTTVRFGESAQLLDYGFANFETVTLSSGEGLYPLRVEGGMRSEVPLSCVADGRVTVEKGAGQNVKESLSLPESVKAPLKKGDKVGVLSYTLGDQTLMSFDVLAAADVEALGFLSVLKALWAAMIQL